MISKSRVFDLFHGRRSLHPVELAIDLGFGTARDTLYQAAGAVATTCEELVAEKKLVRVQTETWGIEYDLPRGRK